ncbi:hypothetical protein OPQ81_007086 [Rhizoctonia solani]|nr:hypothetical protein OPQ81_007086 [Rhizoctonia solani]
MSTKVMEEKLRLYSKELAEHTFNQWIMCLRHAQSQPQPSRESRPASSAQLPPWFPPNVPNGIATLTNYAVIYCPSLLRPSLYMVSIILFVTVVVYRHDYDPLLLWESLSF